MTAKKRARYEIKEKEKIINELDKNLHVKGPNVGKPNFYLVAKLYPQYKRKMLQYWYSKKDTILASRSCASMFKDVDLAKIINMDETSIYLDYPCNYSSRAKNPLTSKKS